jgi:hypothetical protein
LGYCSKSENSEFKQHHFEPLLLQVAYGFRATILNKSCSPIVTLQVFYNNLLPKAHRSKGTGAQNKQTKLFSAAPKLYQI